MRGRAAVLAAAAAAAAFLTWFLWPGESATIEERLAALARDLNRTGLDAASRADRIGAHFTHDAQIDLGQGSTPIDGRATIVGMLTRLEPRTARFTVGFEDVTVSAIGGATAQAELTAEISSRGDGPRDTWMDAREFAVSFRRVGDEWLISRVRAVETIR
jgi:hypothetical protein